MDIIILLLEEQKKKKFFLDDSIAFKVNATERLQVFSGRQTACTQLKDETTQQN